MNATVRRSISSATRASAVSAAPASSPVQPSRPAPTVAPENEKQQKARLSKMAKTAVALRDTLWPGVEDKLWLRTDRTRKGFTTIPRGMPLIMDMIADASKQVTNGRSVPAGKCYLVLWCRVRDEAFLRIEDEATAAFEAGYGGERNVTTWREHLRVLKDLGFIDFKPGSAGPSHYVLLFNPYHTVKQLHAKRWVQEVAYTTLLQRTLDFGATDLEE